MAGMRRSFSAAGAAFGAVVLAAGFLVVVGVAVLTWRTLGFWPW